MLATGVWGSARMKSTQLNKYNGDGLMGFLKVKRRFGIMSSPYFFLLLYLYYLL